VWGGQVVLGSATVIALDRRAVLLASGGGMAMLGLTGVVLTSPFSPFASRGHPTSFGWVALLGSSRLDLGNGSGRPIGHHGGPAGSAPVPSIVHGAWTQAVVVDLAVANTRGIPRLLSPGQFRVRVAEDATTVSMYDADRVAGPIAPGTVTRLRVTYLVPPPDRHLLLEFADPVGSAPIRLGALGPDVTAGVPS
jgi:hypothetical protein